MTVFEFKDVLLQCCDAVYHIEGYEEKADFIVWAEVGARTFEADDHRAEETTLIAVDFFTKKEFSDVPNKLKQAFEEYEISYKGPDIVYDKDTGRRNFAYTVELI